MLRIVQLDDFEWLSSICNLGEVYYYDKGFDFLGKKLISAKQTEKFHYSKT